MVAEAVRWVDVGGALREWARDFVPSVSRRVFFGAKKDSPYPYLTLARLGGRDERAFYQFEVWADTQGQADAVAAELGTAADEMSRYRHEGTLLHGATAEGPLWLPDRESNKPRNIVEVTVFATPSS